MIKKAIFLLGICISTLFSKQYMVQIEPYEKFTIKAEVSGKITFVNKSLENSFIKNRTTLVKINLKDEKLKLDRQKNALIIQRKIVKVREKNYKAKKRIKQLSQYEKNLEELNYLDAKKTMLDIQDEIKRLKNEISKKEFSLENLYLQNIFINKNEYVNQGDSIYEAYDISKKKITLYLKLEEVEKLKNKSIYINGKKTNYKVIKISKITDKVKISKYKVSFVEENKNKKNYFFNKLIKVELK